MTKEMTLLDTLRNAAMTVSDCESQLRILLTPPDTDGPLFTGGINISSVTKNSYVVSWSSATDPSGLSKYQLSIDNKLTWEDLGLNTSKVVVGRTPNSTDTVYVKAVDTLGNQSLELSATVTLLPEDVVVEQPAELKLPKIYQLEPSKLLSFADAFDFGQAYDRDSLFVFVNGKIGYNAVLCSGNMLNTVSQTVFLSDSYVITLDDVELMTINPADTLKKVSFNVPMLNVKQGWHILSAKGLSGETCIPLAIYVYQGEEIVNSVMPVISPTYDLKTRSWKSYGIAEVPADNNAYTQPLPFRPSTPFSDTPRRAKLFERDIIPRDHADTNYPRITNGVIHPLNQQSYYFTTFESDYPGLPSTEGPRGKARCAQVAHLEIGRKAIYGLESHRFFRIDLSDGHLTTLAGWGHESPAHRSFRNATVPEIISGLKLYGNWDKNIKPGFSGAWGFTFLKPTLAVDTSVTIPNDGLGGILENPHSSPPIGLVFDTRNNRIVGMKFDPVSHKTPAYCYEFASNLNDPWDGGSTELGEVIVNERMSHRIIILDGNGKYVRTLLETPNGDDFAYIAQSRIAKRRKTVDLIRQENCILPEGGFYWNRWWYFGSNAMAQIRRIHLDTGELQIVVPNGPISDGNCFYKIARSPGTFGPDGTVFLSTWTIANKGRPIAYLPNGTPWAYSSANESMYGYGLPQDSSSDYSSAVAIGGPESGRPGALIHGSSTFGIREITLALPGDEIISEARWTTANKAWNDKALSLSFGEGGWNPYSKVQPWGISPEIDDYLIMHGHVKPK